MRKLIVYLLALHFLSGSTLLIELGKLPFVLQHFQTHQRTNPGIDFSAFLTLHYSGNAHRNSDDGHRQLPLLSMHVAFTPASLCSAAPAFPCTPQLPERNGPVPALTQHLLDSGFRAGLLKPPMVSFN